MNFKTIWLALCASLLIVSCSKEASLPEVEENLETNEKPDVYVENGILNIKNKQVYEELIIANSKKTQEELEAWQDSLGFSSYQSFYNVIFDEYERIIEGENPIDNLEKFKLEYEGFIKMAEGKIDDLPDYSLYPNIDMFYGTIANLEGKFKIEGEIIDASKILKTKSSGSCYKATSNRKMWINVHTDPVSGWMVAATVGQQKKVWFAWTTYSTSYYWEVDANPAGYYYTPSDVPSNYTIQLDSPTGYSYIRMWNRGVGDTNACIFTTPIY